MIAKHLCPYLLVAAVAVATWAGGQGATLTLEADPAPGGSRTYDFRAEIVGGSDNDRAIGLCTALPRPGTSATARL
jgi:hypothetical protein